MKATGIVVEYNPFHNGHVHHLVESRKQTNADIIIAVMSGNFLQRGEPAIVDKWVRAKMALQAGADIIIELPYAFATAHAPIFAKGSIEILDAMQCTTFCFGSEEGSIEAFHNSLQLIHNERQCYEQTIQDAVQRGLSYPKALNEAYKTICKLSQVAQPLANLALPNNILGFHYIEAAKAIHSSMEPRTIQRIGAQFHDAMEDTSNIASATGIRQAFFEREDLQFISNVVPKTTFDALVQWHQTKESFGQWATFYPLLRYIILRDGPKQLRQIADISEGIENVIYKAAHEHAQFEPFMRAIKSQRYTWTRLQRMLTHIFTGYTKSLRNEIVSPSYLRLLGMTKNGQQYLRTQKKNLKLPVISKVSSFSNVALDLDMKAADLYEIGLAGGIRIPSIRSDYRQPPIRI